MAAEDLESYHSAYRESFPFHDENVAMLRWYADRLVGRMRATGVKSLLSLGIGYQTVSRALLADLAPQLDRYVIIEGSQRILDDFRRGLAAPPCLELVHGRFEEHTSEEPFDVIEMGFVLEHVDDPGALARRYRDLLAPGRSSRMFIAVPNARSLHRLLGVHAGLLGNVYQLSDADRQLGHKRYFDMTSLEELVVAAGLAIEAREGILLKPFSTGQLRSLQLAPAVRRALYSVGCDLPEICNAMLLETRVADG